jgi:hypothetical protein
MTHRGGFARTFFFRKKKVRRLSGPKEIHR